MTEKRGAERTAFRASVRMLHPELGEYELLTRDMSHSGLYMQWNEPVEISMDDRIIVQSLDIDDAPLIHARVVRVEDGGFAVTYLLDDAE